MTSGLWRSRRRRGDWWNCAIAGSTRGWVEWVDEPVAGYPKRPVARDEAAAKALKARTLTNLYNARPQWLADAHAALDAAVAAAYGWDADISEEDALGGVAGVEFGAGEVIPVV